MLSENIRGKRYTALALFLFVIVLAFMGVYNEDAMELSKFFTPYVFMFGGAMYGADAYFANQRVLPTSGGRSE